MALTVYTIGHSTHPLEAFITTLRAHSVEQLIDIRSIPRSRHNPQYNREDLARAMRSRRIAYRYLGALGGRRRARPDSINDGWRNASFRGYADYMQSDAFTAALETLMNLARRKQLAIMCAEAVPWRCHRSLVGDALLVRGVQVLDIFSAKQVRPHKLTSMARVRGRKITYPAGAA